ncbi:SDR family oxidoreductase [Bermanella sp. WJH001]|uniref:SDR family oxidoreductase n=1 Tax=Bermanella sp. WJH001 TaxID=3048005 RepID=UPI0024BED554|nr:SDR family oxidoreductase [Bermanella sp. WJH001]MDJ1537827.1 SDR family oxidoreductase [Bermanella sp. WJH001]
MSQVVLITGANRGIGLSMAQQYVAQGCEVIAVCRESSDEIEDLADLVISGIDLTLDDAMDSVTQVLELAQGPDFKLDILINNAGLFKNETLDAMEVDQIREQFEVNALAPLKVTHALLPFLKEGSKVVNITSRMGSIEDNTSGAYYGYRASKAALNAFTKSFAMDLKPKGIAVAVIHPGFVQTRMVGFNGDITPDQAAKGILERTAELTLDNTGGFWHSNGQTLPW